MAEVVEALAIGDAGFVRRVAIKRMLASTLGDASRAGSFLDEARIASRLHHSNIVGVLDYGVFEDAPFQVLEFVDGLDARTLLKKMGGSLPLGLALYIVTQVGHALSHAHEAQDERGRPLGIVHRDVTPANVLISWDGDVKLADFGVALATDRSETTQWGFTKGTPRYMSPEQALATGVDARADVFSLGCVLHTLLTGESPLAHDRHVEFYKTHLIHVDPAIPDDVAALVRRATAFDRSERFPSAAAMTEAVGRALAVQASEDPKLALKAFTAPLRGRRAEAAPPAALDQLFDLDLVLERAEPEGTRVFGRAPSVAPPPPAPSSPRGPEPETELEAAVPENRPTASPTAASASRPQRAGVALVLVVSLVAAIGLFALRGRMFTASASPRSTTTSSAPTTSALGAAATATPPAPPEASASSDAPASGASSSSPLLTPRAAAQKRRPGRALAPSATATVMPLAAETGHVDGCTGIIHLHCPGAPGARVSLDGAGTNKLHGQPIDGVGCGSHRVSFSDKEKGARTVVVEVERAKRVNAMCGFAVD